MNWGNIHPKPELLKRIPLLKRRLERGEGQAKQGLEAVVLRSLRFLLSLLLAPLLRHSGILPQLLPEVHPLCL
jgi:hypothetical protein